MARSQVAAIKGIQRQLVALPRPSLVQAIEPKGVVYTKRWVVDLLLNLSGYTSDRNLVDAVAVEPAAGDGAFLGPMIERLVECCERLGRPLIDCGKSLAAFELSTRSADRARAIARETLEKHGVKPAIAKKLAAGWVKTGDYLLESTTLDADFVIGNPPYVRLEDIPEETATVYRNAYPTMRGRADLYIGFYEAALRQLKSGGVCAFICADRWMRNQYGGELRRLVTSAYAVEVVLEMHNADAFHDEVDAYPAISVIRRQTQGAAIVASAGAEAGKIKPGVLSQALLDCRKHKPAALPKGLRTALVDTWFTGAGPWPCQSPDQLALLRRLEAEFPALETNARVGIGVATGNDKVFVTKDPRLVEKGRLLKLALAGDVWTGEMQWSGNYLVDPWNCDGLVQLAKFPRLKAYYEAHATALQKRHIAVKNNNVGWYKTIDRVTHSLTDKPKLYIPDIKSRLEPVLDNGETYPHHNLYYIQSDVWDLEVLGGLLMSAVGQFFVESYGVRMRGGYLRFQAQYLRRIRVPAPESLSEARADQLRQAFRDRDKQAATLIALDVYGIEKREMERALGH
jgi:adenine-specific DNA-methyltransferase